MEREVIPLEIICEIGYKSSLYVLTKDGNVYRPHGLNTYLDPYKHNNNIHFYCISENNPTLAEKVLKEGKKE